MEHQGKDAWIALRYGVGLTATLAGLDKFFNLFTDWSVYASAAAGPLLPASPGLLMEGVGVVECAAGAAVLAGLTRVGAYVASGWLLGLAAPLMLVGFYDVALRDVVLSVALFTLARLVEEGDPGAYHHYHGAAPG